MTVRALAAAAVLAAAPALALDPAAASTSTRSARFPAPPPLPGAARSPSSSAPPPAPAGGGREGGLPGATIGPAPAAPAATAPALVPAPSPSVTSLRTPPPPGLPGGGVPATIGPAPGEEMGPPPPPSLGPPSLGPPSLGPPPPPPIAPPRVARRSPAPEPSAVPRHTADERFFLTPAGRLLEPGHVVLSDDEVVTAHLGFGVTRWLELDLAVGALPIPGAIGGAVPAGGIVAGGAAGLVFVGMASAGVKLRLLEEGQLAPAVSFSYDVVDIFGGAFVGGGFVILGRGVAGGAAGAGGAANLQLNLFTLAVTKRLASRLQLSGGTYVVDNHHFLPQGAVVAAGATGATTGAAAGGGGAAVGGVEHLPTKAIPFAAGELWLGKGFLTIGEVFPRPDGETFGTFGFRWVSGRSARSGLASFMHLKLDVATIIVPTDQSASRTTSPRRAMFLPWLGAALYLG